MHSRTPAKGWLIAGHYGGQNTGDDAMLMGVLRSMPPDWLPFTSIISRSEILPESPCQELGMSGFGVLKALRRSRGLIIGGGTHFQDEFSGLRALRHFRYMIRYVVLSMIAHGLGKPVLWLGLGFGPITRASTRGLVRWGSRYCTAITARDAASFALLQACRPRCEIRHAFDLCPLAIADEHPPRGPAPILGICPVYCSDTAMSSCEQDLAFWESVATVIAAARSGSGLQIKVFKFRSGDREADNDVCDLLVQRLSAGHPGGVELIEYQPDPVRVFHEIAACSHFISARYHGAMMSWLAGCRLLFVPYHRKVSDLAAEIGLAAEAQWPLDRAHSVDQLRSDFDRFLADGATFLPTAARDEIRARAEINRALIAAHSEGT